MLDPSPSANRLKSSKSGSNPSQLETISPLSFPLASSVAMVTLGDVGVEGTGVV